MLPSYNKSLKITEDKIRNFLCKNENINNSESTTPLVSLQKICWKSKPYEALDAKYDRNFILKHETFVDPSYVIQVSHR